MSTPTEYESGLTIGVVEGVSPEALDVAILDDAPHGTALGTRWIQHFPTINGYVSVPTEVGSILGVVTWIGIDRERGRRDDRDMLHFATPRRRMRVVPLGVLRAGASGDLSLDRGVPVFPTVGDPVLLPAQRELHSVFRELPENAIEVGRALGGTRSAIAVDPNRIFGRHLAVLGNTGSGKSCTVVQLLRSAASVAVEGGAFRCVVFDANGEFAGAFADLGVPVVHLGANPEGTQGQLRVPGWVWNSNEWRAVLGASAGVQLPYLRVALRLLRTFASGNLPTHHRLLSVSIAALHIAVRRHALATEEPEFKARQDAGELVVALRGAVAAHLQGDFPAEVTAALQSIATACDEVEQNHKAQYWNHVPQNEWMQLSAWCTEIIDALRPEDVGDVHEDDPVPCDVRLLRNLIEEIAAAEGQRGASWAAPLLFRLDTVLANARMKRISLEDQEEDLATVLDELLPQRGFVVIDLSLIPTHVVHAIVAVMTRLIFEAHERSRRLGLDATPTLLVAEEAHTFITRRHRRDDDVPPAPVDICRESFERVAREGRKFGVSLIVTSQRPSELSETVLSQCNTFIVHRVVNDLDQNLIRRLTPDSIRGLLDELPSLPSRSAFLLGWAVPIPVLVEVAELAEAFRPRSEDPKLLEVWGTVATADWTAVAADWAGGPSEDIGNDFDDE